MDGVDGDVAAAVAGADDQDPLAAEDRRVLVGTGVQELTVELAGDLRVVRGREGAVGDHDTAVELGGRGAVPAGRGHPPPVAVRFDAGHGRVEAVALTQAEDVGVVAEVPGEFRVPRIVRCLRRHGELGELGGRLRGDQMRRLVDRAHRIGDVPQPPDGAVGFEADEVDAVPGERAGPGESRGPRPDQRILLFRLHVS